MLVVSSWTTDSVCFVHFDLLVTFAPATTTEIAFLEAIVFDLLLIRLLAQELWHTVTNSMALFTLPDQSIDSTSLYLLVEVDLLIHWALLWLQLLLEALLEVQVEALAIQTTRSLV